MQIFYNWLLAKVTCKWSNPYFHRTYYCADNWQMVDHQADVIQLNSPTIPILFHNEAVRLRASKSLSYIAFVMSSCLFNGLPSTTVTGPSLMSAGYLKGGPKFMQKNSFQKRAATFVTKFAALFPYKYLGTGQVSS